MSELTNWYGGIPKNWDYTKVKFLFKVKNGGTPKSEIKEYWDENGIIWFTPEDISKEGKTISNSKRKISELGLKNSSASYVKSSSLVLSTRAPIGNLKLSTIKFTTNQGCKSLENNPHVDMDYYYYIFSIAKEYLNSLGQGTTFLELSNSALKNTVVPLPDLCTQKVIANFLNKKTQNIDDLIIKKLKLIELLEEKRQSMITEAVTRGLNTNVKMKDSGVEWIGEIPEHWSVQKIKKVAEINSSNVDKKSIKGEVEVLLCNYVDVYYNNQITENLEFMKATAKPEQVEKFTLKYNDVIITKDSESPNDIAIPSWVSTDLEGILCGYHLALVRAKVDKLHGHYLYYSLESNSIREQFYSKANGVTRFGLPKEAIKNGIIPCPPLNEQQEIATYLHEKNKEIELVVLELRKQIEKLKEYRKSLIYEAVTGKIEVRDY
ncbi:restriction endonuclease subunit S [Bacillus paralicheniformis]|uniref:restriction endonuclease subunit S n=1 Tax=Bacillus paralicheniformis TaxID=1648923 RepID=UPI0034D16E78